MFAVSDSHLTLVRFTRVIGGWIQPRDDVVSSSLQFDAGTRCTLGWLSSWIQRLTGVLVHHQAGLINRFEI